MVTISFRNLRDAAMVHCVLVYDQVVNRIATGVEVID